MGNVICAWQHLPGVELHDRLEAIVVELHALIQTVQRLGVGDLIRPFLAQIGAYLRAILLFYKTIVVLLIGFLRFADRAARLRWIGDGMAAEARRRFGK